jgi:hypothetical protein
MKVDGQFLGIHLFLAQGTSPYAMRTKVQKVKAHNTYA